MSNIDTFDIIVPEAPSVDPSIEDTNRLYDIELTSMDYVSESLISQGIDNYQSSLRNDYLKLMGGNPIQFTVRFSAIATAVHEVVETRLDAEDLVKAVSFTIGTDEVIIPGNKAHLFCFFNDFGNPDNQDLLNHFYEIILGVVGTIPCSKHYLHESNDGKRSRATSLLLAINEGDQISFMVIRGWQIVPNIVMRSSAIRIPVEYEYTSMLNYSLPISGEEQTVELKASSKEYSLFELVSFKMCRVTHSLEVVEASAASESKEE